MKQYLDLLQAIQERGTNKPPAREGMPGSRSLFGYQNRYDLSEGFPAVTTKPLFWKGVVAELLWFLRGDTNIKYLVDQGVHIWNEDAYNYYKKLFPDSVLSFEDFVEAVRTGNWAFHKPPPNGYKLGDCGYQYGKLWRAWEHSEGCVGFDGGTKKIDQISDLIQGLKSSPMSRRHIISAWNPATLDQMALHPCHVLVQFNCRPIDPMARHEMNGSMYDDANGLSPDENGIPKYFLDCQLYQRSADVVLGVPFNIASYALLTHIFAKIVNMVPGEFIHSFGDVHIYDNHRDAVREQLDREPRTLPKLVMADAPGEFVRHPYETALHDFNLFISKVRPSDFRLEGYTPHPKLESETKLSTGLK